MYTRFNYVEFKLLKYYNSIKGGDNMVIWKDIKGYEGKYQVSNKGRVRSLDYKGTKKKKLLKASTNKEGYIQIRLYKNGKGKTYFIHRLVAQAFLDNPDT